MNPKRLESVMKGSEGGLEDIKRTINSLVEGGGLEIDTSTALQHFFDSLPISSIPGIGNSPVLELNSNDCLQDAIRSLYERNISGAPVTDAVDSSGQKFVDRHIGFIDFYSMVLWSFKECEKANSELEGSNSSGFFSMIKQTSRIGRTKIAELAKSFLWDPFFPVHADDTLFHALLLFAKHPLEVIPVVEKKASLVTGFITMNAVVQQLLQCSGLEWFDRIADKRLSEFGIENNCQVVYVNRDQSIADTLCCFWENQIDVVPVEDRKTKTLIGNVRKNDILLLLENDDFFVNRKNLTIEKFIELRARRNYQRSDTTTEGKHGALLSAGILHLKSGFSQRMDPVTNQITDTLKQAMKNLMTTKSSHTFIVDESNHVTGVLTLREAITYFSPPAMDSRIRGGGFFESVLEQAGCHLEKGTLICDN